MTNGRVWGFYGPAGDRRAGSPTAASESKGGFLPSEEEGPSACFLLRSKIDALGLPVFHYFQSLVIKSEFINLLVLLKVNYTNLKKKKKRNKQEPELAPGLMRTNVPLEP